ncbi:conserved Plasmodium protein, unknown function [Plasmodium vinckei brucechwatti]|uniref:Uncharacterized protein n=1 Tax=Plasmodium vinckei brucechwatti TaxID=119398 RepID=A0A6V7SS78_PLAVN|nr:conserved Plasmodium protein, unknown function [Plasmodium vinckei brucechwatti]
MGDYCYIMPGEFGLLVQGILAASSISILIAKYVFEKPRRTLLNFFEDVALLLLGNTIIHFFNIFFSMYVFHRKFLKYIFQIDMDECSIYFIQVILDGTLGLYLQATLLDIFKVTKYTNENNINKMHTSIDYNNNNNNENFQSKNKLMPYNTKLPNKEVCINIDRNNNLKNDEIFMLNKTKKNNPINLIDNLILWISVILSAKFIVVFVFVLTSPISHIFTLYTISYIKDIRYRLIAIMIIIPFFFNFVLYYISDIIIKKKSVIK